MRNVLLLTIDALRADHLSCYGYERETTPVIDRLARSSRLFERAYSHGPLTTLSFPAMFSGCYNFATAPVERKSVSSTLLQYSFPRHFPSLPEMFQSAGYRTCGHHANALLSESFGYSRGFDEFKDGLGQQFHIKHRTRFRFSHWLRNYPRTYRSALYVRDTFKPMPRSDRSDRHNDRMLEFVDKGDGPFFAWVHYMDVHHPLLPDPRTVLEVTGKKMSKVDITRLTRLRHATPEIKIKRRDEIMAVYDATIWETDRRIGSLMDRLNENGHLDDAVIAITSDHGEAFMEHGSLGHPVRNFYEEQLRVPLVIKGLEKGRDANPVGLIDLTPTLTGLAGIEPSVHFMGQPLPHEGKIVYSGGRILEGPKIAITTSQWRFIWDVPTDIVELYDLTNDPSESNDVSPEKSDAVGTFRDLAEQHMEDVEKRAIAMKLGSKGTRNG